MSEELDTIDQPKEAAAIGDNSLISAILTQRVEETPTKLVPEVESPDPSLTETEETEYVEVIEEKKAAPEPDYTEYEAEPAPLQKKDDVQSIPTPANAEDDPEEAERVARRRAMTAKWGVRLYDKFQGLLSIFTYDRLNTPKANFARRTELMEKAYSGKMKEHEGEELKVLNGQYDAFMKRRGTYQENVHMSEDMRDDIQELMTDLISVSKREVNPMYILLALLVMPVISNLITAFSHKMQHNTNF